MLGSLLTGTGLASDLDDETAVVGDLDRVERLLWVLVLASVALDVYTTYLGLSAGLSEGNPVMRWAIHDMGFVALAVAKLLVVCGAVAFRARRPKYGTTIALGLALPWTVTVAVNTVALATL